MGRRPGDPAGASRTEPGPVESLWGVRHIRRGGRDDPAHRGGFHPSHGDLRRISLESMPYPHWESPASRLALASTDKYRTGAGETFIVTTPAQTESTAETAPSTVVLTDVAAQKVKALIEQEGRDDLRLRVAVQPGGCSGLRYQLFFDERSLDGDVVSDFGGVGVVVDRMSAPYLTGATIDFADRIDAQGFTIDNPNAQNSCACGDSFH
ncbi:hypothetical protein GCM10022225_32340 [Plantactinospora mayteni]|uniref:Core domain-containing protein n=1 Tax=Plantactinospora mayteni TaxID=566021 RepID=A0ABQ4ELI5_9ACTN|nr:hypothetical protein Pma05_21750 [Plantactinospora mayteni]